MLISWMLSWEIYRYYNLTTLCLNGTLPCVDFMDVIMGDRPVLAILSSMLTLGGGGGGCGLDARPLPSVPSGRQGARWSDFHSTLVSSVVVSRDLDCAYWRRKIQGNGQQ